MPRTYLIRGSVNGARKDTYLVPEEDLIVRYQARFRPTGRRLGGIFTEVSLAEADRTSFMLSGREGRARNAHGAARSYRHHIVAKADLRAVVRILTGPQEEAVAAIDAEIEVLAEQVKAARERRAEFLAKAWRSATPASVLDFDDLAEAKA